MHIYQFFNINHCFQHYTLKLRIFVCSVLIAGQFIANSPLFHLFNALLCLVFFMFGTSMGIKGLLLLLSIPVLFIGMSGATIALTLQADAIDFLLFKADKIQIGCNRAELSKAIGLSLRSYSLVISFYVVFITVSFSELLLLMQKLRISEALIEHFMLSFIFIQTTANEAKKRITAQKCRLAYTGSKHSFKAKAYLFASILQSSMQKGQLYMYALENRNCGNALTFYRKTESFRKKHLYICLVIVCTEVCAFLLTHFN